MSDKRRYLGVIEGFYGETWSWQARQEYPGFMSKVGLNAYIYAPKSDSHLRKQWREPWSEADLAALQGCALQFSRQSIEFGIGLSPISLTAEASVSAKDLALLDMKIAQIDAISTNLLCILFDDVPSDGSAMAKRQLALCDHIRAKTQAKRIIVCPSYYSTDPILEKLFGARPTDYWRNLGMGLDSDIDYFWTGEQVCSKAYSEDNLQFIAEQLRRRPVLWDNYPVNDGAKLSRYLHLKPFTSQRFLSELTAGHFANPMNQAYLSQLPLATLAFQYQQNDPQLNTAITNADDQLKAVVDLEWRKFCEQSLGQSLAEDFFNDVESFQYQGLDQFSESLKTNLVNKYAQYDSVYAAEIVNWLEERYRFDPACLTG